MTFIRILIAAATLALAFVAGDAFGLAREHARLERNRALVLRSHRDVWSERDVSAAQRSARQLYAPKFILHDWTGNDSSGAEGVATGMIGLRQSFPDWVERPQMIVAEGDLVADTFLSTGTQAGDLGAIPRVSPGVKNKGKHLAMPELSLYRIADGKIAEQWGFSDIWNAEIQLGMFDPDHWHASICGVTK